METSSDLPLVTFELLPEGVEETNHAKIRGKDSPGRRNKSKGLKVGGFWICLRNRKKTKFSGAW